MAINPAIALGVQAAPPLDMLGAYGKAMSIKNLVDGAKLQQLQMTQAQRQMDNEDALRGAYAVGEDGMIDERGTIQNLVRAGQGPQAMKLRNESDLHRLSLSKADREAEKARLEMIGKTNQLIGQELAAIGPNPTYATVMDAGLRLNQQGLQIDLNQIPEDPAKLLRFVNERKQRAMDVERQLAEFRAATEPKTELGKLLRDQAMFRGGMEGGNAAADRPLVGGVTGMPGGGLRVPEVTGVPPADPFTARIAREQYGAPGPFRYNNQGQLEGVQVVQDFERGKARDSAARVEVNAFPPGAVEPSKGTRANIEKEAMAASSAIQRFNQIETAFDPAYLQFGPRMSAAWADLKERGGARLAPGEQRFLSEFSAWSRGAIEEVNTYIQEKTGAAMGVQEAQRLRKGVPDPGQGLFDGDSPTRFKAKLDDTMRQLKLVEARSLYALRNGLSLMGSNGEPLVPLSAMPKIMDERGLQIEQQVRKQFPNLNAKELKQMVVKQLGVEFGIGSD